MAERIPGGANAVEVPLGGDSKTKPNDSGLPILDVRIRDELALSDQAERARIIQEITSPSAERRKAEHKKRAEVYRDGTRQYALRALKAELSGNTYLEMEARTPNVSIAKKIVNKKSRVYLQAPERKLEGLPEDKPVEGQTSDAKAKKSQPQQMAFDAVCSYLGLNGFMKKANRWVELHHNVLISILPAKSEEEEGKFCINLDLYSPELYDVIADFQTGKIPVVVVFSYFTAAQSDVGEPNYRTTSGVTGEGLTSGPAQDKTSVQNKKHYVWWSNKYHFTTDDKGVIVDQPEELIDGLGANPIKRLPFVSINKDQANSYWSEGGEDLVDNSILINVLLADMYYIAKFQGMGIIVATGKNIPKQISIGPSRVVVLEHGDNDEPAPKIEVVNADPPLGDHRELIEQLLAFTLSTNDLEPGTVAGKLEATGSAASGIQEIIQKSEISTSIEDEQEVFRTREPQILQIAAAWMRIYAERKLLEDELLEHLTNLPESEAIKYKLAFPGPQGYINENDKITTMKLKKESGLFTFREMVAEAHPTLDEEGLNKKIAELMADQAAKAKLQAETFGAQGKPQDPNKKKKDDSGESDDEQDGPPKPAKP